MTEEELRAIAWAGVIVIGLIFWIGVYTIFTWIF